MKLPMITILAVAIIGIGLIHSAYAETYQVNIPTGASDPLAPFSWQNVKNADVSGKISIVKGDIVLWKNGDTTRHTVTSGTQNTISDKKFDSGILAAGKSFSTKFTELGEFPFHCTIHPWMEGSILVTSGYRVLFDVGSDAGDGMTVFDIEYDFNRIISKSKVNEDTNSITFELLGHAKTDDHTLTLWLPIELISGDLAVIVDGKPTTEYSQTTVNGITKLVVNSLNQDSQIVAVIGAKVVPEFGTIAIMIAVISIASIVLITKSRLVLSYKV